MNKPLTLAEAAALLGLSKTAAQKAARAEQWVIVRKVGNVHLYDAEDVLEYRDHRLRTEMIKKLGWHGRGLYRAGDIDIACPVCGGFAVEWPAPPELAKKTLCVNGHHGTWGNDIEWGSDEILIEGNAPIVCSKCRGTLKASESSNF